MHADVHDGSRMLDVSPATGLGSFYFSRQQCSKETRMRTGRSSIRAQPFQLVSSLKLGKVHHMSAPFKYGATGRRAWCRNLRWPHVVLPTTGLQEHGYRNARSSARSAARCRDCTYVSLLSEVTGVTKPNEISQHTARSVIDLLNRWQVLNQLPDLQRPDQLAHTQLQGAQGCQRRKPDEARHREMVIVFEVQILQLPAVNTLRCRGIALCICHCSQGMPGVEAVQNPSKRVPEAIEVLHAAVGQPRALDERQGLQLRRRMRERINAGIAKPTHIHLLEATCWVRRRKRID